MLVNQMASQPPSPDATPEPFDSFYRRVWPDAARWATALVGDVAAGEEIAQEAFARIAGRYATLANPGGYLRVTIVNLAKMHHRGDARRRRREQAALASPATASDADPATEGLLTSLARLPYQQRAVLALRYWADWDEVSIAAALGCRPTTVRSHAKRGLDRLRHELEETDRR